MSSTLHIAVAEEKGSKPVTVLHLRGDLDASTQPELEEKAGGLIEGGAVYILIDLAEIGYMGSAGLRALHSIANKLPEAGQLKLLRPSESVAKVFKTLGFDSYFDIHIDLDEAVQSF
jgi:anti-sigma B factor antagonist